MSLSVGQAGATLRFLIGSILFVTAVIVAAAGRIIDDGSVVRRVLAVVLVEPFAVIGFVAVAYISAPHSRFGTWLDEFLPRLRHWPLALLTALSISLISFIIVVV